MVSRTPMKKAQFASPNTCPVEVFCRLRPPKDNEQQVENASSCVKVASDTEMILYSSENAKNGHIRESRYEFSHILAADVSQSSAFKELAVPLLDDLIQGKSSVLFTYGITGSGKTYTMMGPLNNPGLIPRSFDVLFNSIGSHLGKKYLFRSDRQNGYDVQSESDILLDRQRRELSKNNPRRLAERTLDTTSLWNPELNENCSFSVFVTFVEIYNNYIYDLFDDDILNKAPQSKQLRDDQRGRPYIRDVKEMEVRSSDEAIDLLNTGLKRRRIAHTQLNTESSRSHSVLSMRLVQYSNEIPPNALTKDDLVISTIHLVDLAGSERVNRAKTVGERVKEASNINASLMVLRQCFETLRENQSQGTNKMVPYRESKLTSFFKSYFDGEGRIRMILCVNPTVDGYEEIQHALKFGELTKDVLLPRALPPPVPPKVVRNPAVLREMQSQPHVQPILFTEFNGPTLLSAFPPLNDDDQTLEEHLRRRIDERHRLVMLIQDQQDYLRKFTHELITDYDSSLSDRDDLNKENDQQNKTIRHLQTRIKLLEKSQNEISKTHAHLERENKTLKGQLDERTNELKALKAERRKDKAEAENKFKLKITELEQQFANELKNKEVQMKDRERQHDDKLNIIRSMAISINASKDPRLDQLRCGTPTGKSSPQRRPPTPYTAQDEEERQQPRRSQSFTEIPIEVETGVTELVQLTKKRGTSEERILQTLSSRQGPAVPPKRFRM